MSTVHQDTADTKGRRGENVAALTLQFLGWKLLSRRFTSGRGSGAGEVDIIAQKGKILAFIEVKKRPSIKAALEAITDRQKQRIILGAETWLAIHPADAQSLIRFDVVAVPHLGHPLHVADAWRANF